MNAEKMKHVILFFLERINNTSLGITKLMKLLYYIDFDHYEKYGSSVTGAVYRKLPHGPVPDKVDELIKQMIEAKVVQKVQTKVGAYKQIHFLSQVDCDLSHFIGTELEILEDVATRWKY